MTAMRRASYRVPDVSAKPHFDCGVKALVKMLTTAPIQVLVLDKKKNT